jgi:uncharacterized membrane protein (Fun14 family)
MKGAAYLFPGEAGVREREAPRVSLESAADPGRGELSGRAELVPGPGAPRDGRRPGVSGDDEGRAVARDAAGAEGFLGAWSPALIKGGLSFFVGFCLGYLLRTFLKVGAIVVGLVFLCLFGLVQLGVVPELDWQVLGDYYGRAVERIRAELAGFKSFAGGSLPAAGMAGIGLLTGFKRS